MKLIGLDPYEVIKSLHLDVARAEGERDGARQACEELHQLHKWRLSKHRDAIVLGSAPIDEECFDEFRVMSVTSNEDLHFKDDETERMVVRAPELAALLREMVDHGENMSLYLRAEALLEFIRTGKP